MTQSVSVAAPEARLRPTITVGLSLAAAAAGLTLLYLGMRAVMDIGGACAEGGPFVPRRPCPEGVPLLMLGGIWGGIIACGFYVWQTMKYRIPSLIGLAWPALFLSLGWNFLEYGVNPPDDSGLVWGWLVCGVIFVLMGGLPLLVVARPTVAAFRSRTPPGRLDSGSLGGAVPRVAEVVGPLLRAKLATDRSASESPAPAARAESGDLVSKLERLARLRRSGELSDTEYEAAKQSLLKGGR